VETSETSGISELVALSKNRRTEKIINPMCCYVNALAVDNLILIGLYGRVADIADVSGTYVIIPT
jgi:hypothetical protein